MACAAVAKAMHDGAVEATRYPRNPLDIAAQQIVAMTAMDTWAVDDLFATLRRAAPVRRAGPRRRSTGVLDMLSGRYPSDEFAELRPRITWDRVGGTVSRARRREARGDRQRRHDPGSRPLRRVPGGRRSRRRARRRARRGDGLRDRGRRDLRARCLVLARRGDHARSRAGVAGSRRAREDAVLERRSRRAAARARADDRPAGARPAAPLAVGRNRSAHAPPRSRRSAPRKT